MPRKANVSGRSANGSGSIRRKTVKAKNGREYSYYEARVTVGHDPETGQQIQKSISGKSQTEVRQKMSALIVRVDMDNYKIPSSITLSQWLDEWMDTYVHGMVKPYTEDSYRSQCRIHIDPFMGDVKLTELSTMRIQKFYNSLFRDKGLSPKTIKNIHGVLHKSLEKAVALGYIDKNPTALCDLPKIVKKEIAPLEQEDITRLLKALEGHPFEPIYLVTLFTGLRQGEVLGLTWDAVDFDRNTIFINKQLIKSQKVGGEYLLATPKNGQSRLIIVAPTVMNILRQQQFRQNVMKHAAGDMWSNPWNLVFTNEIGEHLTHINVYKRFKRIVRAIGLDETRFHDLRHFYAVASLEAGDDIKTVQENLGHATAAFTMSVYAHASQKMRRRSAENMENYIHAVLG